MSLRCGVGWGRCRVLVASAPLREILQSIHQRSPNADEPDLKRGTWAKKGDSHSILAPYQCWKQRDSTSEDRMAVPLFSPAHTSATACWVR